MKTIPYNLNDIVLVKLTEAGQEYLSRDARFIKINEEGLHSMQFWELMQIFGPVTGLGMPQMFDSNVILKPSSPDSASHTPES